MYLVPIKFTQRKRTKGRNRFGKKKTKQFRCLFCQAPLPQVNSLLADGKTLIMKDLICKKCKLSHSD